MPEAVYAICEKFLLAVVVTVEEDAFLNLDFPSSMPDEFHDATSEHHHDQWLRYKRCGIKWVMEEAARFALSRHAPQLNLKAWPQ
jgi:hypothetical protein